ncbi:MAG: DUF1542 domain-containing protein [Prevotella sp.]|nr:DUF1542 domain-containing protein [Candidatus Prevotella equi]
MAIANTSIGRFINGTENTLIVIFMSIFAIILGNCFNFMSWAYIFQMRYYVLIAFICYAMYFLFMVQLRNKYIPFKYYVLFLTVWPISCHISSIIFGGTLSEDLLSSLPWLFVSTLFIIFHRFHFTERRILIILGIVAIGTVGIQIMQLVEPLFTVFGDPTGETLGELVVSGERNGIVRLFVGCIPLQMLMLFLFWCKFMTTFRIHWALLTGLMLFSVYMYLTKQVLIATVFTLGLSFFMLQGRRIKIIAYTMMVILTAILAFFWEDLFGDMIKDSQDDSFSHAIRFEFIGFISEYFITHPIESIFGHGFSIPLIKEWIHKLYHLSDIGFFGEAFSYGWPWSIAYFLVVFRILVTYRNRIPLYIRLYVIATGFISIFIFPYRNRIEMYTWISAIYICSLYISDAVEEKKNTEDNDSETTPHQEIEIQEALVQETVQNEDINNNTNIQE